MGYYSSDPNQIGSSAWRERHAKPGDPPAEMTVGGKTAQEAAAAAQRTTAETPVQLAFRGFNAAVEAQKDLNREVDAEYERRAVSGRPVDPEDVREKKASIANSPAAQVVKAAAQTVVNRRAEAQQHYDQRIAGLVQKGDAAQEERNSRYAKRIERELAATGSPAERLAVAQKMLRNADPPQRGVLVEELPSLFAGRDTSWIEHTLVDVDPELGAVVTELRLATQCEQMANYAEKRISEGFKTGNPPQRLDVLGPAVRRLDPDAMR